jgi:hypothetical protein
MRWSAAGIRGTQDCCFVIPQFSAAGRVHWRRMTMLAFPLSHGCMRLIQGTIANRTTGNNRRAHV